MQSIAQITFLVREYDEAIEFFAQKLGFSLLEDTDMGSGKRWVVVGPPNSSAGRLFLARAATPEQGACAGNQSGGRVFLCLQTDNFRRDHGSMIVKVSVSSSLPEGNLTRPSLFSKTYTAISGIFSSPSRAARLCKDRMSARLLLTSLCPSLILSLLLFPKPLTHAKHMTVRMP